MRKTFRISMVVALMLLAAGAIPTSLGCAKKASLAGPRLAKKVKKSLSKPMVAFATDSEFDEFAEEQAEEAERMIEAYGGMADGAVMEEASGPMSAPAAASESKSAAPGEAGEGESITNVQEAGVDEGDIVKVYKGYLVVLRRGRLFTVSYKDAGRDTLRPISSVDAYAPGFTGGTWYDEMLIHKDRIVVIGYSYQVGATEIGQFRIDDAGRIKHLSTHFMDSNDYYSSRNYASRLVGSKLIFYMPFYIYWGGYGSYGGGPRDVQLPRMRRWVKGNETTEGVPILGKTDIFKPVQATASPTLHMVTQCDLDTEDFDCTSKAVLGPYSRSFYVSPNAIYVWVTPESWYGYMPVAAQEQEDRKDEEKPASYVYMILIEDMSARVLKAHGAPIDQFSFREEPAGFLDVVVREDGYGDAMWNPEFTGGKMALIRTPLESFSDEPEMIPASDLTVIPSPSGYELQNRFVGDYLLYGTGSSWYHDPGMERNLYVKNVRTDDDVQKIPLGHTVDRIEVMGDGAVVIGGDGQDMKFSSVELTTAAEIMDTYTMHDAVQGETRSHGFFYKPTSEDEGILGLPIRRQGDPSMQLVSESAEVLFLDVDGTKQFSELGSLASKVTGTPDDSCVASCVDWYGNSRPIFLAGRIFALLGYELVEGVIEKNEIRETGRLDFFVRPGD
jgi:hypothetical protein